MKEGCGRCPVLPPENGRAQSSGSVGERVVCPNSAPQDKAGPLLVPSWSQAWVDREAPPLLFTFFYSSICLVFL